MNYPASRHASLIRNKTDIMDMGVAVKTPRTGIRRGHANIPHNIILRGLGRRVDRGRP